MRRKELNSVAHSWLSRYVLLFVGLALAGGISTQLQAAEQPPDADITSWVSEALRQDPRVDAGAISATTKDGIVTLTGKVSNLDSKVAAVRETKKIQGVVAVQDRIVTSPSWRPDVEIEQDIRHRILNSAAIEAHDVRVTSHTGKITLAGHVASQVESEEAEVLARETRGVREIRNALVVDSTSSRSDQEIKNDVVAALDLDVYLRGLPIIVEVGGGNVTLTGTVKSLYEKDRARDAVRRVSQVKSVDNRLNVDWLALDGSRAKPPILSDAHLEKNVALQLERDARVDAAEIAVVAAGGHVFLSGSVPYGSQKKTATLDARDTVGVAWVTDNLLVVGPPREDRAILADEKLEMEVDYPLSGLNIDVTVKNGVVELSGTVHTWYQKSHAQTAAWRPRGVKQVINLLEVARDSKYSDSQLEKKIQSGLTWNWKTYWVHDDINVDVDDGIAYLRGHVDTWSERAEAARVASHTSGVWRVYNSLSVGDYPYSWDAWDGRYDSDDPYVP